MRRLHLLVRRLVTPLSTAVTRPTSLENDAFTNLPAVAIGFHDASCQGRATPFRRNQLPRHLQKILPAAFLHPQTDTLQFQVLTGPAQRSEIQLRKEFWRDLLSFGERSNFEAKGSRIPVKRHVIDRREGGHIDPPLATSEAVHLKLRKVDRHRFSDAGGGSVELQSSRDTDNTDLFTTCTNNPDFRCANLRVDPGFFFLSYATNSLIS